MENHSLQLCLDGKDSLAYYFSIKYDASRISKDEQKLKVAHLEEAESIVKLFWNNAQYAPGDFTESSS